MIQKITSVLPEKLLLEETVRLVKTTFEQRLQNHLPLTKISAPLMVMQGTGINDNLNGIERPVAFPVKAMEEATAEIVQSLAKWKRLRLKEYGLPEGQGVYTDMRALRPDEDLGPLHSIYVDQWDWEQVMTPEERHLDYLKSQVKKIFSAIKETEMAIAEHCPLLQPILPSEITFVQSETLLQDYPELSPKEREHAVAKKYGAVFLIGIGGPLSDGIPHDGRSPDYDDWSTPTSSDTRGLNGDILFWNPVLDRSFEISSMGIRVDAEVLKKQLRSKGEEARTELYYHQQVLEENLPQTIGGGIGQSRLCMFLLRKRHIGEVQAAIWPEAIKKQCASEGIALL